MEEAEEVIWLDAQHTAEVVSAVTDAPLVVAVRASDPIVGEGTAAYLRGRPGIVPVPATRAADVVLVLADGLNDDTVAWMERMVSQPGRSAARFVLVSDWLSVPHLVRAARCGPMRVLPRRGTSHEEIVRALFQVRREDADGWTTGPWPGDPRLEDREIDVLRLVADGLDTAEIAQRLNYSERTIKHVVRVILDRLKLSNRPHAVAFALRNGLI